MKIKNKWKIKGLEKSLIFKKVAPIILDKKLRDVFKLIDRFFEDDSVDNLHDLRISVRRFRYLLEIFYPCYDTKELTYTHDYAKQIQDLIGEGRDLDVMKIKVKEIGDTIDIEIPSSFYKKIDKEKLEKRSIIKTELRKFMEDEIINKFIKKKRKS